MPELLDPDEMPAWLASFFGPAKIPTTIVAGINQDDCAIVDLKQRIVLLTLDFLNANPIALELGIGNLRDIGRLLVASNLSDLYGSGGRPFALLLGITLPHGSTKAEFNMLMKGVKFEASRHHVAVIGGDTKLGASRALVGVAIGAVRSRKHLFLKNGAKPGDVVWASGHLGSAAAAWGFRRKDLGPRWKSWAKKILLEPTLPAELSRKVSLGCLGRGGTDVSDGLGADLSTMCEASKVGVIIDENKIPQTRQVRLAALLGGRSPSSFAFASGGDFQFLVTTGQTARKRMKAWGFHEIGQTTKTKRLFLRLNGGALLPLPTKGHRDFRGMTFVNEIDHISKAFTPGLPPI